MRKKTPVEHFKQQFRTGNAQERASAVDWLGNSAGTDAIDKEDAFPTLALAARDPDANVRLTAAKVLNFYAPELTSEPLCILLRDPVPAVRIMAALALSEYPCMSALDSLIGALKDFEAKVKEYSMRALKKLMSPDSIESLSDFLDRTDDDDFGLLAMEALSSVWREQNIPFIAFHGARITDSSPSIKGLFEIFKRNSESGYDIADYLAPIWVLAKRRVIDERKLGNLVSTAVFLLERENDQSDRYVGERIPVVPDVEKTPEQEDELLLGFMFWCVYMKPKLWAVQAFANTGRIENLLSLACDDVLRIHKSNEEGLKEVVMDAALALFFVSEGEKAQEKSERFYIELESFLDNEANWGRVKRDFSANTGLSREDLISIVENVIQQVQIRIGKTDEGRVRGRKAFGRRNAPEKAGMNGMKAA